MGAKKGYLGLLVLFPPWWRGGAAAIFYAVFFTGFLY